MSHRSVYESNMALYQAQLQQLRNYQRILDEIRAAKSASANTNVRRS